jgi:hypothetical protein
MGLVFIGCSLIRHEMFRRRWWMWHGWAGLTVVVGGRERKTTRKKSGQGMREEMTIL